MMGNALTVSSNPAIENARAKQGGKVTPRGASSTVLHPRVPTRAWQSPKGRCIGRLQAKAHRDNAAPQIS